MSVAIPELVQALTHAIEVETAAYRASPDDGPPDEVANAVGAAVNRIERQLLAIPMETVAADMATSGDMDYVQALALSRRRWLIMEGGYAGHEKQAECRLVDLLLRGSRFDDVNMLWHVDGKVRPERPREAEFEALRERGRS